MSSGAPTRWTSYPGRLRVSCRSAHGATWLQVDPVDKAHDPSAFLTQALGSLWGYHVADVNLALGDLVADVRLAAAHRHG